MKSSKGEIKIAVDIRYLGRQTGFRCVGGGETSIEVEIATKLVIILDKELEEMPILEIEF